MVRERCVQGKGKGRNRERQTGAKEVLLLQIDAHLTFDMCSNVTYDRGLTKINKQIRPIKTTWIDVGSVSECS